MTRESQPRPGAIARAAAPTTAIATAAALVLACVAGPSRAENTYELTARSFDTREPQRLCLDFFCNTYTIIPPQEDLAVRQSAFDPITPLGFDGIWQQTVSATARISDASAVATAKLAVFQGDLAAGVAATASMSSVFHSESRAKLKTTVAVTVELDGTGLIGALAYSGGGGVLAVSFLHQTTGRFMVTGTPISGSGASFSERLHVEGSSNTWTTGTQGTAAIIATSAGNLPSTQTTGAWTLSDFQAPQQTGDATAWVFNHFETLPALSTQFKPAQSSDGQRALHGTFTMTLEQSADAAFNNPLAYRVGGGTSISADFAHTSTFSFGGIHDPTGHLDLSGVAVSLRFVEIPAVPEPGSWLLLASGMAWLGLRRRSA